ncbi:hypothetical protein [Streptomyces sp. G45]|uniref:hypothetical protein n=1 Tax=Streptomyces sp. G45 TaxID=3406627 RepID=UPI003C13D842
MLASRSLREADPADSLDLLWLLDAVGRRYGVGLDLSRGDWSGVSSMGEAAALIAHEVIAREVSGGPRKPPPHKPPPHKSLPHEPPPHETREKEGGAPDPAVAHDAGTPRGIP